MIIMFFFFSTTLGLSYNIRDGKKSLQREGEKVIAVQGTIMKTTFLFRIMCQIMLELNIIINRHIIIVLTLTR